MAKRENGKRGEGFLTESDAVANYVPYTGATTNVDLGTNTLSSGALSVTHTGAGNAFLVEDSASVDGTPFLIDQNGRVVKGHTAALLADSLTPDLQTHTTSASSNGIASFYWGATATGVGNLVMCKSRGATAGTYTVVQDGDDLGNIRWMGADGTDMREGARIYAEVDGTPGDNDIPTAIVVMTQTAAGSLTEAARWNASQEFVLNSKPIYGYIAKLNDQTGTTYTVDVANPDSDTGKIVTLNNGSSVTVTLPATAPIGFGITVYQKGAGQVTFSPAGSATLVNQSSHTKTAGQHAVVTLFVSANSGGSAAVWVLAGDTGA